MAVENTEKTIARAAGVVLVMNLISRMLGFVRDAAIAGQFGASAITDAYWVAYTIPFFLQAIFGVAFVSVMVPIFTSYIEADKREEGWKIASGIFNLTAITLVIITVLGYWGAPLLVKLTAPGFSEELAVLTTDLTRIMFPSIVFMGLGMLITGILNSFQIFALPAFAPGTANIIVILSVLFFGGLFGIEALAWGTLVGFVLFLLVQVPTLYRMRFKYSFRLYHKHPAVRKFSTSVWAVVLGMSVNQIYLTLNRIFASGLEPGSISALNYAYRLMSLPLGIFAAAVATVIFPALAHHAAAKQQSQMSATLMRGLRLVLFITIPAAVGMAVLQVPLVKLLFERGAFAPQDTLMTANSLMYFVIGLPALGINLVVTRAFYALDDVKTPVVTGLISVVVNVLFSLLFLDLLKAGGLALADTLAAAVNTGLMMYCLARKNKQFSFKPVLKPFLKMVAASLVTGLAAWGVFAVGQSTFFASGVLNYFINTVIAVGVGAIAYGIMVTFFRLEEAGEILAAVRKTK